jgi:hypothetical protein
MPYGGRNVCTVWRNMLPPSSSQKSKLHGEGVTVKCIGAVGEPTDIGPLETQLFVVGEQTGEGAFRATTLVVVELTGNGDYGATTSGSG